MQGHAEVGRPEEKRVISGLKPQAPYLTYEYREGQRQESQPMSIYLYTVTSNAP